MDQLPTQIVNGLMLGGVYALIAVAFNLIFGVLRIVYFAHGQVMMVGAYVGLAVLLTLHNVAFALIAAALVAAVVGLFMERVVVRPLLGQHHLMPLVSTVSAGVIMEEVVRLAVNHGQTVSYPESALAGFPNLSFGTVSFGAVQLLVLVISVLLVLALGWVIRATWYGRAMRAVAQSPDITAILGVNIPRTAAMTFAISSALTGAGGVLFGLIYASFDPYFGEIIGIKALAVVLLGGLGSLGGAAAGGILLGLVEALAIGYLPTSWENAFAFGLMMVILLVRPGGLAGSAQRVD